MLHSKVQIPRSPVLSTADSNQRLERPDYLKSPYDEKETHETLIMCPAGCSCKYGKGWGNRANPVQRKDISSPHRQPPDRVSGAGCPGRVSGYVGSHGNTEVAAGPVQIQGGWKTYVHQPGHSHPSPTLLPSSTNIIMVT